MNGLKMHWRLIQESDGRTHLNMQWESCALRLHARFCTDANSQKCEILRPVAKREGCAQLAFTAT
jgi:hypothetical protein